MLTWSSKKLLKVKKQSKAFLIRNRWIGNIRIYFIQIGDEVTDGIFISKRIYLQQKLKKKITANPIYKDIIHPK